MGEAAVPDNVTISYRGANYQIGRGPTYYGIWRAGDSASPPLEWWPDSDAGWYSAWSRFVTIEMPGSIAPVSQETVALARPQARAALGAALLGIGVLCATVGLFPSYLDGSSLASDASELLPHVIYLVAWAVGALWIALGGTRWRAGAFLAAGVSVVTFGFFLADAGTAISAGTHVVGAGLVLALIGWLFCAAGSAAAVSERPQGAGASEGLRRPEFVPVLALSLCAIGTAATFAPSWDSYVLQTTAGTSDTVTAGNIFANPAPVIGGDVVVMIALVAVVIFAAMWRPVRYGALLMAGALVPMVAQAISALVQIAQGATPAMFGISSATAASEGLTITSGLTLAFWIYCVFLVLLIVAGVSAFLVPGPSALPAGRRPEVPAGSGGPASTF